MKKSDRAFTVDELLFKASAYCAASEHCIAEVREKLRAWGASAADADHIVAYLADEKFVDELRYCEAFVRDKFRFNRWGRIKIGVMLRAKGLPDDCIAQALLQIPDDDYLQTLTDLLRSKSHTLKSRDEYDRRTKLIRFAQSRGFEMDMILQCLE